MTRPAELTRTVCYTWRMDLLALIADRPLLLDGGLGPALMNRGFAAGECPEEWNVSHPDDVEDIHRGFFAAGSDIVNTNTFGGTGCAWRLTGCPRAR